MVEPIGFLVLGMLLLVLCLVLLFRTDARRLHSPEGTDLPLGELLPRHYKSFAVVEKQLWSATRDYANTQAWENGWLNLRDTERELIQDYLKNLRSDFLCGRRIFGAILLHSASAKVLAGLEMERIRIELAFHFYYAVMALGLRTGRISVTLLTRLTDVVTILSHDIRTVVRALEREGDVALLNRIVRGA